MKRNLLNFINQNVYPFFRKYVSLSKSEMPSELTTVRRHLKLDEQVSAAIDQAILDPREHPGIMNPKVISLPTSLKEAINKALEGYDKRDMAEKGKKLSNVLWGRLIPPENKDINETLARERRKIKSYSREIWNTSSLSDSQEIKLQELEERVAKQRLKQLIHPWKPLNTDYLTCLQYLISRTPAEYAVLCRIFNEISVRDPDFIPHTFFDFGSGVASGYWAVREVWDKPLSEAFHVDTNVIMNDLANVLMKRNKTEAILSAGVMFRQFFPASPEPMYDIVLSGFSLLELPSFEARMETIFKLWRKTENYLVIVEDGTNAGYNVVMEARNLVLSLQNKDDDLKGSVFAPCPHDAVCPRFFVDNTPCNFKMGYITLPYSRNIERRATHFYSYIVLKKGQLIDSPAWPRCVRETEKKSKHVKSTVCMPDGKLANTILTKGKNCRNSYNCARATNWGDLLPGDLFESQNYDTSNSKNNS